MGTTRQPFPGWIPPLLVLALGAALFSGTLHNPFTSDDVWVTIENQEALDLGRIPDYFTEDCSWIVPDGTRFDRDQPARWGFHRPLVATSYAFNAWLGGMEPFGWRLTNLILHLLASLLVLVVGMELLGSRYGALIGALLFTAHPIHTEAVASLLGGRAGLMATVFVLASWWVFLEAERFYGTRRGLLHVGSAALLLLGLFSKENAAVLPAVLVLSGWVLRRQSARSLFVLILPHLVVVAGYAVFRILVIGWVDPVDRSAVFGALSGGRIALSVMVIMASYLRLLVAPWPLHTQVCYQQLPGTASVATGILATFLVAGVLVASVWLAVRGRRRGHPTHVPFGVLFFFLCLLPVLHLVPLPVVMAERFLYLASVGPCLAAGSLVCRTAAVRPWLPLAVVLPVLAGFGAGTVTRNADWADLDRLYTKAAACNPDSHQPYNNLGTARLREGHPEEALVFFEQAIARAPRQARPWYNLGVGLQRLGQLQLAEEAYRKALTLQPNHSMALVNLGALLQHRGDLQGAEARFRQAIAVNPDDPAPLVNLGTVLHQQGRTQEAEKKLRHALRLVPGLVEARFNLARLLGRTGREKEAERLYRGVLEDNPGHALAWNNLGNIFKDRGEFEKAEELYREALARDPDCAPAHYNLANLQLDKGNYRQAARNYMHATSANPEMQEAWLGLAYARLQMGLPAEAREAAEKANLLDPDDQRVKKLLDHLDTTGKSTEIR